MFLLLVHGSRIILSLQPVLETHSLTSSFRSRKRGNNCIRPDFLLVDLRELFFRSRVGGTKKINKKSSENDQSENDQLTGHFQSFFFQNFFFSFFFFNISRKTVNLVR